MSCFKPIGCFLALTACFCLVFSANAQSETYLIKNATLYTATAKGTLNQADLLVENGVIVEVGQNIAAQPGTQVIDATAKSVTPGLINAFTNLGLVEIDAVDSTVDAASEGHQFGASFDISPAINFRSTLIPQNRINGLTRAVVLPWSKESVFAGTGAVIALNSSVDGLIKANAAQMAYYGDTGAGFSGGSRASAMAMLERALQDARYLRENESRLFQGGNWQLSQSRENLQALYPVLDAVQPLIIHAHRADDILRLVKLAQKYQIKLVIEGGGEAWMVAELLADAQVPVIIDPISNIPTFESLTVRLDGAAKLYQAGVKLLFTGGGSHNAYLVRQSAGNAVAHGLPAEAAIEAMTINTAEVFDIKNYGQLRAGMDADIVIWDGDPLEVTSLPDWVMIQGVVQPLVSRASRLRDRYRHK